MFVRVFLFAVYLGLLSAENLCDEFIEQPYFDKKIVLGIWKVYNLWTRSGDVDTKCFEIEFQKTTPKIVKRIKDSMESYLEKQPNWKKATLLAVRKDIGHEMLLIQDAGTGGNFTVVPYIVHKDSTAMKYPYKRIQMKLVENDKYLLTMECTEPTSLLFARSKRNPDRRHIAKVVKKYKLPGISHPMCY